MSKLTLRGTVFWLELPMVTMILLKLKDKYRTFLLSNINAIHYDYIMNYLKTDFGFDGNDHLFEKTYYSHLTGKRKPEPANF
jgi:FMN phosphatase YigB (HAD superfamily)